MSQLWKIVDGSLSRVDKIALQREDMLENWIAKDPSIIALDTLIITRQHQKYGGRIDLLGLDRDGGLTIIELKRDKTPRDVVAQILDYASWIRQLTTREIYDLAFQHHKKSLPDVFRERFGETIPEILNTTHRMLIVASELDDSSKRIVEYLAEVHKIDINTAFFHSFSTEGDQYLVADWLMDKQQVRERAEEKTKAPWSGYYYVNIGHGEIRSWNDMRKYGFIAAGHGKVYSSRLFQLSIGDPVFAYQKGKGYLGYGIATSEAMLAKNLILPCGRALSQVPLEKDGVLYAPDDLDLAEYAVGIEWKKTFSLEEGQWLEGGFANQNIVCKLRHQATLDYLFKTFEVDEE